MLMVPTGSSGTDQNHLQNVILLSITHVVSCLGSWELNSVVDTLMIPSIVDKQFRSGQLSYFPLLFR